MKISCFVVCSAILSVSALNPAFSSKNSNVSLAGGGHIAGWHVDNTIQTAGSGFVNFKNLIAGNGGIYFMAPVAGSGHVNFRTQIAGTGVVFRMTQIAGSGHIGLGTKIVGNGSVNFRTQTAGSGMVGLGIQTAASGVVMRFLS